MNLSELIAPLSLSIITLVIVILGIYTYKVLKEAKETLEKFNRILGDLEAFSITARRSSSTLNQISQGFRSGMQLVETISNLISSKKDKS